MVRKPIDLKFDKEHSLAVAIEYKKPAKGWRPTKKFLIESLINPDTGEVKDTYYTPKSAGEEKAMTDECDFLFRQTVESVLEAANNDKVEKPEVKTNDKLAQVFAKYKTYSKRCYDEHSPAGVFQKMFPENHYSRDLESFFSFQNYESEQRGADLPWWGSKYFSKEQGFRAMIVSQDTAAEDAGSIVFAAQFLSPEIGTENYEQIYQEYLKRMNVEKYFPPNRLNKIADKFKDWGINFDFLYITDASKVFKKSSWRSRDFDEDKSRKLFLEEIDLCRPDLIILLGAQPLWLLNKNKNYASVVEEGKPIFIKGTRTIISPFFIGNGPSQLNFKKRMETADRLIKKYTSKNCN